MISNAESQFCVLISVYVHMRGLVTLHFLKTDWFSRIFDESLLFMETIKKPREANLLEAYKICSTKYRVSLITNLLIPQS
jgi:hypothetical protein